jgi:hypothetical protein
MTMDKPMEFGEKIMIKPKKVKIMPNPTKLNHRGTEY